MERSPLLVQTASETPASRRRSIVATTAGKGRIRSVSISLGLDLEVVGDEPLDQGPEGCVVGPLCPLRVERREKQALGALAGTLAEVLERDRRMWPISVNSRLSAAMRSGAVSKRVPSKSTSTASTCSRIAPMVREGAIVDKAARRVGPQRGRTCYNCRLRAVPHPSGVGYP